MTKAELYQKACMLPLLPGVYIIRDKSDTIIYIGRYLSALRVYVRFGRSDKPFAGRFGVVGGKRRHERLGSVLRQFILL